MLVLSRKKNESIVINDDIVITVVEIRGDKVRLGIVCPKEVPVRRQEVCDAIKGYLPPVPPPQPRQPTEEDRAFVRAVLDNPDDDTVRLVYADFLEEHGDARGEFIRLQCRLAKLPLTDPDRPGLEHRERELWASHGAFWREGLPSALRYELFERGFVETVHVTLRDFLDQADEFFAAAPVRRLRAQDRWPSGLMPSLVVSPYLARLREFEVTGQAMGRAEIMLLAGSPNVASLRVLGLRGNAIGDAGCGALASSASLAGLTALDLSWNQISAMGGAALASSPHLGNLERLDLSGNPFDPSAVPELRGRFGDRVLLTE